MGAFVRFAKLSTKKSSFVDANWTVRQRSGDFILFVSDRFLETEDSDLTSKGIGTTLCYLFIGKTVNEARVRRKT